jgi:quinohemoprotein ethanol dehydrogenase
MVAYRADNGDKVWEYKTQTGVIAPPITYSVDGEQYVAVMVGWGGAFGLTGGMPTPPGEPRSRILAFKLGGTTVLPPLPERTDVDPPARMTMNDEQRKHGEKMYMTFCVGCHGVNVVSNKSVPDLRWMPATFHENFKPIVLGGALKGLGMVGFNDVLNDDDADAIHAYILDKANDAKEKRDNPDAEWWYNIKLKVYETVGDLMAKYL